MFEWKRIKFRKKIQRAESHLATLIYVYFIME